MALMFLKIGAVCKWCVLVDLATLAAAAAAGLVHLWVRADPSYEGYLLALFQRRAQGVAWVVGALVVGALPFLWGEYPVVPPLPAPVAAAAVAGKPTIVAFTDFECPFCRKLAPVLDEVRDNWGDRVVLVRKMAPLPVHSGAMPAALAYVCTPEGQREEMAKKLYAAPEPVLSPAGVTILARDLHVDADAFARCLESPGASREVLADRALFDELELHGLPYTFIGRRSVAGFNADAVRKYGAELMDGDRPGLPLWGMVAAAGAVAAALVIVTLLTASRLARA
jgi:protein-disulfide isomerase